MDFLTEFTVCTLGAVISYVLPCAVDGARRAQKMQGQAASTSVSSWLISTVGATWRYFWRAARPYLPILIASVCLAAIIVALEGDKLTSPAAAFLAGYTSEATVEKFGGQPHA